MTDRTVKRALAILEKKKVAIGKYRDELREIVADYQDLLYKCEYADECLQAAIDSLSEMV